jgi:mannosyltransferase
MRLKNWQIYAIILVALAVRVYRLADQSFWFDETFTWWTSAVVPWPDFIPFLLPYAAYTPPFYLLTRLIALLGTSEYLFRFLAVFFSVLSVPLVERVGRRVGGARVGTIAALLFAVNPFAVWYAQDARMYTMAAFFALLTMDGFMRAIEGRGWRRMIIGALAGYATLYLTMFTGYIQLMWWLPHFRRQAMLFRQWFGANLIAALPLVPWLLMYLAQPLRGFAAVGWIPHPSPWAIPMTLWNFVSGDTDTWNWVTIGMLVVVSVVAGLGLRQRLRWRGLLLAWLLVPPTFSFLLSLRVPTYVDRYFAFCQYALLIFLALGLWAIPSQLLRIVVGVAIGLLMIVNVYRLHADPLFAKENWRGAAAIVNAQIQAGDRLGLQDEESLVAWRYYYQGSVIPMIIDPTKYPAAMHDLQQGADRIWLVFRSPEVSSHRLGKPQTFDAYATAAPSVQQWLATNCRQPAGEWRLASLSVLLCEP